MGDLEVETKINSCLETRPFGRTKGRRSLNQQRGGTSSQGEGINNKQKLNQIKLTNKTDANFTLFVGLSNLKMPILEALSKPFLFQQSDCRHSWACCAILWPNKFDTGLFQKDFAMSEDVGRLFLQFVRQLPTCPDRVFETYPFETILSIWCDPSPR